MADLKPLIYDLRMAVTKQCMDPSKANCARVDVATQAVFDATAQPLDMVLHCPKCHTQHVDEPDERTPGWVNPPHRSHLCHACGTIWRPADVPTNGVREVKTRGKADSWPHGVQGTFNIEEKKHGAA